MNDEIFRAAFNSALDGFIVLDDHLNFVSVNPSACQVFGLPEEELLTRNIFDFFDPEYHEMVKGLWADFLSAGILNGEIQFRRADGSTIDVEYRGTAHIAPNRHFSVLRPLTERKQAEAEQARLLDELKQHRTRLEDILASVPGVVWEAWGEPDAASQRINFISDHIETMLGYTVGEWLSTPNFWLSIVHPDDREEAARVATEAFVGGEKHANVFRWLTKDGRALWVETISVAIADESGKAVGMRGVTLDISARKQAEEALKFSEERFRALFEQSPMSMQIHDASGKIVRVNRAWEVLWNTTLEEVGDYNVLEDQQLVEKGIMPLLHRVYGGEPCTFPEVYYDPHQSVDVPGARARWTRAVCYPIMDNGRVTEVVLLHQDITEWKQAELNLGVLLEASEGLATSLDYEETLKNLAEVAVPSFADYCVVDMFEEGATRRVARSHRDLAKLRYAVEMEEKYPPPPDAPAGSPNIRRSGQPEIVHEVSQAEMKAYARSAEHLALLEQLNLSSYIGVPLHAHGEVRGAIIWLRELGSPPYTDTDLELACDLGRRASIAIENALLYRDTTQALAVAEAANRAKDEFVAVVSHELRTPLNAISGWASLLRNHSIDAATTAQALEIIERNCSVQSKLVEDILEISRIVGGNLRLEQKPVEVSGIIQASIASVGALASGKSIQLFMTLEPTLLVNGDEVRLQQVVTNLLSNAIKFTPEKGQVEVTLRKVGSQAEIRVVDNGQGITPEFLPYVFDRFRQADGSSTRQYGGLGLGLAIVRHLVESHGGSVRAESEGAGQGATFTVVLPLLGSEHKEATPPQKDDEAVAKPEKPGKATILAGMEILVVDDEPDACYLAKLRLEALGAQVTTAPGAEQALELLTSRPFSLLISDIAMPGMSGYNLIEKIRADEQQNGAKLPAIALTAFAGIEERHRALASGFDVHLAKPISAEDLVKAVRQLWAS